MYEGQLPGSCTDGGSRKGEFVLTEEYVPSTGSSTLPRSSFELIEFPCLSIQSLPKPARRENSGSSTPSTPSTPTLALNETTIDPDSELAHALQPLLEQEALLETFVQEATAKRRFEDAQTLRDNLKEIRGEIDRVVTNAEREQAHGKGKGRT